MSFALWVSVIGVVIGIIQLMLVLSVMSGFLEFLENRYTSISSHMVVIPLEADPSHKIAELLKNVPEVEAFSPFSLGQSMLVNQGVAGVTLEGIDLNSAYRVTDWKKIWLAPPISLQGENNSQWIWLGVQLAKKIRAKVGDSVEIFIPGQKNELKPFKVTALTKFGLYDHDLHYARIDGAVLRKIFRKSVSTQLYKVKVKQNVPLFRAAAAVRSEVKKIAKVRTWNQINQNLFLAVEDQKRRLFLVLEIIVGLAGVNVISLLMMSTHYRRKDIAILRAMGLRARGVFLFFLAQGTVVGAIGVIFGVGFGVIACALAEKYQPSILNEAIYNTSRLPFKIEIGDVVVISAAALALCIVFSIIPALRAAYARPAEALRYE